MWRENEGIDSIDCPPMLTWSQSSRAHLGLLFQSIRCHQVAPQVQDLGDALVQIWEDIPLGHNPLIFWLELISLYVVYYHSFVLNTSQSIAEISNVVVFPPLRSAVFPECSCHFFKAVYMM